MAHSKEEVVLTRMQELRLKLTVFKVAPSDLSEEEKLQVLAFTPEETIAWYVIKKYFQPFSLNVPDEVYSRNVSCTLNLISMFLLMISIENSEKYLNCKMYFHVCL